jgi:hypothetical protein
MVSCPPLPGGGQRRVRVCPACVLQCVPCLLSPGGGEGVPYLSMCTCGGNPHPGGAVITHTRCATEVRPKRYDQE